jgi:hypothetical protein
VTILVAPGYAPFEQYYSSGENQGAWTDLYSLGATCYRAIAGVPPLDAITRSKGVLGSSREVLVPARTIGSGRYSDGVLRAIDRALEFAEKDRPQSIAEWRRELRQETAPAPDKATAAAVQAPTPAPNLAPPVAAVATTPFARRVAVGAAFAGIAALAGAIGAYFVMQGSKPPAPISAVPKPSIEQVDYKPGKSAEEKSKEERVAAEKLASDKLAAEKLAAEKAETERLAAAKAQAEREAAEKAAKQKAIAEKQPKGTNCAENGARQAGRISSSVSRSLRLRCCQARAGCSAGDGPALYHLGHAPRGMERMSGRGILRIRSGVAQSNVWACSWYELAGRRGVPEARARKQALVGKLQPRELKQCQDWADGQSAPSG